MPRVLNFIECFPEVDKANINVIIHIPLLFFFFVGELKHPEET